MSAAAKPTYQFADFELDPGERRLLDAGQPISLTPKVFDTLVLLVERAGRVVSKDELMAALWPRGFVHESNLTKHVWLIRKALGDTGETARFIETVPKLGYRFVAAVQRGAAASTGGMGQPIAAEAPVAARSPRDSDVDEHADPVSSASLPAGPPSNATPVPAQLSAPPRPRRARVLLGAGLLIIGLATLLIWRTATWQAPSPADGDALAIVDFNNLSQNPKDAWLGPALGEMLATEASLGGRLHALPDELVRGARLELKAPLAGGYAPQSLSLLRRRLAADYVLSGSYLVSGSGDDAHLRVDLALQDAHGGRTVASLTRSATVAELPALVTAAGASLREHLGETPASEADLAAAASAQPPTADVARRIGFALDALHRFDPARARDELLGAVAQAPDYAPAYSYLAQAWSALGYKPKALAAARQAASHAQALPDVQRLEIEVQVHKAEFDWPATIATLRRLCSLSPRNPEYRLQLIDALLAAGKPDDTAAVQKELAAMSDGGDPRVELAAARVASAHDDPKSTRAHAAAALRLAQARGDVGLMAEAEVEGATSWDAATIADAEAALRRALGEYQRIDNPHGEAHARQNLANLLWDAGKPQPAREEYQRAMATYQRIGDQNGVAAIYSNLCRLLWAAGDRDAALASAQNALTLRQETGDLQGQAWNLTALATIESDESASDEVVARYREAIALDEQAGDRGHRVFALSALTDLLRSRGDMDEAARTCEQAREGARALSDSAVESDALFQCAQVALEEGDVELAAAEFERVEKAGLANANNLAPPNVQLSLGAIDLGRRDWSSACAHFERSVAGWVQGGLAAGEAVAQGHLALCEDALGDGPASDRALARAKALRAGINERGEMVELDIAFAQLRGRHGERIAAADALRDLAADARARNWVTVSADAQLAEYDVLDGGADHERAARIAAAISTLARTHHMQWAQQRLQAIESAHAAAAHAGAS